MNAVSQRLRECEPYVRTLARDLARQWNRPQRIDADDLKQVGRLAVLRACARFDPGRGSKFGSYAHRMIRGAMQHEIRDHGRLIHVSAWAQERGAAPDDPILFDDLDFDERDRLLSDLMI